MEPKGFMGYPKKGIAHALCNNFGHVCVDQNNSTQGVY